MMTDTLQDKMAELRNGPTAEQRIEAAKERSLFQVEIASRNLTRALTAIQSSAAEGLQELMNGRSPVAGFVNHGPLGHQEPADVATYSNQLESAANTAAMLGVGQIEIEATIKKGVNAR